MSNDPIIKILTHTPDPGDPAPAWQQPGYPSFGEPGGPEPNETPEMATSQPRHPAGLVHPVTQAPVGGQFRPSGGTGLPGNASNLPVGLPFTSKKTGGEPPQ
jgi:hypothetical protein